MKRIMFFVLVLCITLYGLAANSVSYSVGIDPTDMAIQGDADYRFTEYLGIKGGLGFSLMGLINTEAYLVIDPHVLSKPWGMTILLGIPNFLFPFTFDACMISFGGAVEIKRDITDSIDISLRAGAGFPLFFEVGGSGLIRDTQFPLNFWPEAVLSVGFH